MNLYRVICSPKSVLSEEDLDVVKAIPLSKSAIEELRAGKEALVEDNCSEARAEELIDALETFGLYAYGAPISKKESNKKGNEIEFTLADFDLDPKPVIEEKPKQNVQESLTFSSNLGLQDEDLAPVNLLSIDDELLENEDPLDSKFNNSAEISLDNKPKPVSPPKKDERNPKSSKPNNPETQMRFLQPPIGTVDKPQTKSQDTPVQNKIEKAGDDSFQPPTNRAAFGPSTSPNSPNTTDEQEPIEPVKASAENSPAEELPPIEKPANNAPFWENRSFLAFTATLVLVIVIGIAKPSKTSDTSATSPISDAQIKALIKTQKNILSNANSKTSKNKQDNSFPLETARFVVEEQTNNVSVQASVQFVDDSRAILKLGLQSPESEKLSEADFAAGKLRDPWLKNLVAERIVLHRDTSKSIGLTQNYIGHSKALAYFEDDLGNSRASVEIHGTITWDPKEQNKLSGTWKIVHLSKEAANGPTLAIKRLNQYQFSLFSTGEFTAEKED